MSIFSSGPMLPDFLLNPAIIPALSAFCHLALLFLLFFLCIRNCYSQSRRGGSSSPSPAAGFSLYQTTALACSSLGIVYILLCGFNYYDVDHRPSGGDGLWSAGELALQVDLAAGAVAWVVTSFYLHYFLTGDGESDVERFPSYLRGWWVVYFLLSCAGLASDLLRYYMYQGRFETPRAQVWVLDIVSLLFSIFFNYSSFFGGERRNCRPAETESASVQEPLLNGSAPQEQSNEALNESDVTSSSPPASPFSNLNFLSLVTFSWMSPLLSLGNRKTLDAEDVPPLDKPDSAHTIVPAVIPKLESFATASSGNGSGTNGPSSLDLVKVLLLTNWPQMLLTGILALIDCVTSYVGPYLITYLVDYLNGRQRFKHEGPILISIFVASKLVECFVHTHYNFRTQQIGIKIRAAVVGLIYQKSLGVATRPTGDAVNLVSVDAGRVGFFTWYMHDAFVIPIQVALGLFILYGNLGPAAFAGLVAAGLAMLANVPLTRMLEAYFEKLMEAKDARMKATGEVLRNMRVLKLQAWEMKFLSRIMDLRQKEVGWLKRLSYTSAVTNFLFSASPTFVAMAAFGTCGIVGVPLETGRVLSAIATFEVLHGSIISVPDIVATVIQTKVSLDRISAFLRLQDVPPDLVERLPMDDTDPVIVEISNGHFFWESSPSSPPPSNTEIEPTPTIVDINLEIQRGKKVAVCGTVGSGKSSLLCSILGQMPKLSGKVRLRGSTAYVSQSPWIQSGTVEENILFGKEMVKAKYDRVLKACALNRDLEVLPLGDRTLIGERGINLSGGQKQRIQLARAMYQDADVYLLDDPFSAVDAHTGTHIFKECLLNLLASKTVIYVTHQVEFLPTADLILVMKFGRITQAGKFNDILNSETDFDELVGAHKKALAPIDSALHFDNGPGKLPIDKSDDIFDLEAPLNKEGRHEQPGDGSVKEEQKGQLIQEEEREKGRVGLSVYWKYITTAYNGAFVPPIILLQAISEVFEIGSNFWMAWATPVSKDSSPTVSVLTLISVYVSLAFGSSVFIFANSLFKALVGYQTATLLFNKMHACIFRAPMSFFDSTPSGRIISRVTTNQSEVDMSLFYIVASFAFSVLQLLGIIMVISSVVWQIVIIFIPVAAACIWYQQYYMETSRELARIIGVCGAPVIQHFSETISGLITIRSFNQESRFTNQNLNLIDAFSQPIFYSAGAIQWFSFRINMLSLFTFTCSLIFLICLPQGSIDPGIAGLAVTYGLTLNMLQSSVVRNLSGLEKSMVSVERILQYSCIPSEPPLMVESNKPKSKWPPYGEINIHNLQVRYAPHLPMVLKGVSCIFPGGRKTGIVGRTGSGKSTLIQALFRMVDPTAGQIFIDEVDITTIGLHDLRTRLSIIPQDPTMFNGTIRSNLDPLEEYLDDQIWEVLDTCHLGDEVRKKEEKLDTKVTENGENWSMGQRQLVCLARVILKRSKIFVLDEATASVDTNTDNMIQHTLRKKFLDSTVITVAHRVSSILDSDMIVLLENGVIAEYGPPAELLSNKLSLFSKMVCEYTKRSSFCQDNSE